jgi:hypothetical protein
MQSNGAIGQGFGGAVFEIAKDGTAHFRQLRSDLVEATGFEGDFVEGSTGEILE